MSDPEKKIYIKFVNYFDGTESGEFGPFDFAQLTYGHLRVGRQDDDRFLATLKKSAGRHGARYSMWTIDGHEARYSDVLIYSK